jgi:recombination protein RecR
MEELGRLPGIGPKTAQRLSFYILRAPRESVDRLATALVEVKARIRFCDECFFIAEGERCTICLSTRRDRSVLCVVEEPLDVLAIERTAEYHGLYHVLHGALSPIDGVGPGELKIAELLRRLRQEPVSEVILATDPDMEGEATAAYLAEQLAPLGVRTSRLAHGLPVGGELEYADELTLARAFSGRRAF